MATQFGRATWLLLGAFVLGVLLSCGGGDDRSGDGTSAAPANDIGLSGARTGVVGTGSASAGRLPDADTASGTSASGPGSIGADPTTGLPRRVAGARFAAPAPTSTDVQAPAAAPSGPTFAAPNFTSEVLAILAPYTVVGMAWAPDGRLFVWQKNGIVRVIKQGVLLTTPFIDLSAKVNTFDDRGFWGLAFHPNFVTNGYVYLTYVYEGGGNPNDQSAKTSRLTRVTASSSNPDVALPGSEVIVLGTIGTAPCSAQPAGADCIAADGGGHVLGSLQFAADGKLFVGNGDGSNGDALSLRAQDVNSYSGKILRINDDGTAPSDNPFYDGTNSIRSKVWLYGVRNPFSYDIHAASGDIYFGDVGWNTSEEVDRGQRGANYGWPCYEGAGLQPFFQSFAQCQQLSPSAVKPPVYTYDRSVGASVIGGSFYMASLYPTEYRGNFFFADYVGNWIQRVVVDASGAPLSIQPFATNVEAPVTVKMGPDGMLYYLSFTTGQINRIRFNGAQAVASATPVYGYSPLSVAFSSAGSVDSGGGSLSYLWEFGDGTTSTLANPTHVYSAPSVVTYRPKLTVTNPQGASSSATLSVTVGSLPPLPAISTPGPGTSVMPGQQVTFQGSATDPDEPTLPASALSWTVLLHHNTHVHTFVSGTGSQGSFLAENHGPVGTFSYEIILTATDSSGLTASTSVFVGVAADTAAPATPGSLTAVAGAAGQINLGWTAATDNAAVSGYRVERCLGAGCSNFAEVATPVTTSFADSGLASATSYSYRVRAADASGNLGGYSNVATAVTTSTPPPTGLVAAYALNEGAGTTITDASGNGNSGTISGGFAWSSAGRWGGALSFNGVNSLARVPSSASLNLGAAMTLEAWIQPTAAQSGWRTIVQREVDAYFLNASNDTGPLLPSGGGTLGGATVFVSGPTASPINAWTHVALTYNGTTLRLYVNGVLAASQARTGSIQASSSPLWIGGNSPYGEYFQGLIDEIRIYNRALTQAEIQADMAAPIAPAAPDPTPPSVPTNLTATVLNATQINLGWTASTDNVAVTGYQVERCQGVGCTNFALVGAPVVAAFSDTGLAPSTSYTYRVRAADAAGNFSGHSNAASGTTPFAPDTTAPTAPTGLSASAAGTSQINLSWTASTDNVGVTAYRVERCQDNNCSNFVEVGTSATIAFSSTGLSAHTRYRFRVRASDAAGNLGPYSSIAAATTRRR